MPISPELLEILCCPRTKVPVKSLNSEQIEKINQAIRSESVTYADGTPVDEELTEGLITTDFETIYRIDDSIPIMLIDKGIPVTQIAALKSE